MDANGGQVVRLTHNADMDFYPMWSPLGQQITFISDRDGNLEVYIMNADGSNQVNLTQHPAEDAAGSLSPMPLLVSPKEKSLTTWGKVKRMK